MEELRLKLIEACNSSRLNPEALYFVVKDVYRDVTDIYNRWTTQQKEKAAAGSESVKAAPAEGE